MAESLDKAEQIVNSPAGAGGRLDGILDVYGKRQSYMGRRRPIPGDQHMARIPRDDLERIRRSLVEAIDTIDRIIG